MMMDKKKSFVLYDYRDQLKLLPNDEKGKLLMALMGYAAEGTLPDDLSDAGMMCFVFVRQNMDRDNEKYANTCKARAEAGAKGGRPKTDIGKKQNKAKKANGLFEKQNNPDNDIDIDNDIDNDLKKENIKKKAHFVPPTLNDVRVYCQMHGYNVDAERFFDFYTSKDWMIGKNRMKDWRAAVRNWSRSQRQELTAKEKSSNRFHNLEEHGTDYDAMMWGIVREGLDDAEKK